MNFCLHVLFGCLVLSGLLSTNVVSRHTQNLTSHTSLHPSRLRPRMSHQVCLHLFHPLIFYLVVPTDHACAFLGTSKVAPVCYSLIAFPQTSWLSHCESFAPTRQMLFRSSNDTPEILAQFFSMAWSFSRAASCRRPHCASWLSWRPSVPPDNRQWFLQ